MKPPSAPVARAWPLIFLAAAAVLATGLPLGVPRSMGIAGADRILHGEMPYRDFWTLYAPGHFYLLAAVFQVAGERLLAGGLTAVLCLAGATAAMYHLLVRAGARPSGAVLAAGLWVAALWTTAPAVTTYQPTLLLLVLSWSAALEAGATGRRRCLLASGAWLGLAACCKHDVAAYSGLAIAVTLLALPFGCRDGLRPRVRAVLWLGLAAAASVTPAVLWIALRAGTAAYESLLVFPATDFAAARPEAYPSLWPRWQADISLTGKVLDLGRWALYTLPVVSFAAGGWLLLRGPRQELPRLRAALVLTLTLLTLHWLAAHVQINTHKYTLCFLSLVVVVMADRVLAPRRWWRGLLWAAVTGAVLWLPARELQKCLYRGPYRYSLPGPRLAGLRVSRAEYRALAPLITGVQKHTAPGEPIYVGVQRHDTVLISRPELYAVLDRPSCSPYDELHPAVVDRLDAQQQIIAALQEQRVRCVVLWKVGIPDARLDQIKADRARALPGTGAVLLDRYLEEHYRELATYGEYRLLWDREQQAPTPDPVPEPDPAPSRDR